MSWLTCRYFRLLRLSEEQPKVFCGEVLLDFSVYDALRAGFKKIVFIIRHDLEADFHEVVLDRVTAGSVPVDYALAWQEADSLIPPGVKSAAEKNGRTKPWGTVHALLCAEGVIDAPFAIINADDFYGKEAFEAMAAYLRLPEITEGALVPYRLEKTLSPKGTVTRGVCNIKNGYLASVDELFAIERAVDGVIYNSASDGVKTELPPDTPVSMNFWGFPHTIFPDFRKYFDEFLQTAGKETKSECYLPRAVDWCVKNSLLKIRALESAAEWFGITYKEDKEPAVNRVRDLTAAGVYPSPLWG